MARKHIKGLNGLRAIAVMMVVINHKLSVGMQLRTGGYGVRMFFALSGFLIIGILWNRREAIAAGAANVRTELIHFYENRLYRIWPVYFLVVALILVLGSIGVWTKPTGEEVFALLTFTMNIFIAHVWTNFPNYGHLWSIAVEEQFYLWAAIAFLLAPTRYYRAICLTVIALAVIVFFLAVAMQWPGMPNYTGSLPNFGIMAVGGLMAIGVAPRRWMSIMAPFALLAVLALPAIAHTLGRTSVEGQAVAWAVVPLMAVILPGVANGQDGWLVRLLEWRPIEYIGRISYGLYMYHPFVEFGSSRAAGLIEVGASIVLAALSWELLERPILRLRDRRRHERMAMLP